MLSWYRGQESHVRSLLVADFAPLFGFTTNGQLSRARRIDPKDRPACMHHVGHGRHRRAIAQSLTATSMALAQLRRMRKLLGTGNVCRFLPNKIPKARNPECPACRTVMLSLSLCLNLAERRQILFLRNFEGLVLGKDGLLRQLLWSPGGGVQRLQRDRIVCALHSFSFSRE